MIIEDGDTTSEAYSQLCERLKREFDLGEGLFYEGTSGPERFAAEEGVAFLMEQLKKPAEERLHERLSYMMSVLKDRPVTHVLEDGIEPWERLLLERSMLLPQGQREAVHELLCIAERQKLVSDLGGRFNRARSRKYRLVNDRWRKDEHNE